MAHRLGWLLSCLRARARIGMKTEISDRKVPLNSSNHCELIGTKTANQHESAHSWQQMSAIIKERFRA